jgi:tRNA modification GTPase
MIAPDVYEALQSLGEITGEVTREDILDEIFSNFCVGK